MKKVEIDQLINKIFKIQRPLVHNNVICILIYFTPYCEIRDYSDKFRDHILDKLF